MKFARLLLAFLLLAMGTTDAAQLTTSQRVSSRAKSESVRRGSSDTRSSCSNRGYIARRLLITSTRKASSKTSMFDIYDKLVMSTP